MEDFFWSYAKGIGVVQTIADSNVTATSFDSGCILLNNGGVAGWAGIVFSYISNPPVVLDGYSISYPLIDGIGTFARTIGGLTPDTDWFFRAYYETYEGIIYGSTYTIHTLPDTTYSTPDVTTASISQTTTTTASCGGNATNDGGDPITEKGVCWNTSGNPTYAESKTNDGTGTGSFSSTLTGLVPGNTYYVKAYAKNSQGIGYGAQVSVLIIAAPEVYGVAITAISTTTATSGGDVLSANGAAVTARGICWNITGTLDTLGANYTTDGTGTGVFSSSMTGLSPSTLYYIQAYATNSVGTSFSSQGTFSTTSSGTLPDVGRDDDMLIEDNRIYGTGYLIATGGSAITDKGFVIATSIANCTLADCLFSYSYGSGGSAETEWFGWMTGLDSETLYYFKAYATNSSGTAYSAYNLATTLEPATAPVMSSFSFPDTGVNPTIRIMSIVANDGGKAITERGICFGLSYPPRIATDYKHLLANVTGSIMATVTRPESSTQYYFSQYCSNEIGTSYSDYPFLM